MSVQRKLNALLFELQTAQSPLAQAKILARSWRTLRELSATDRKLLARHAGFDGAEQILEGLAKKQMGFAPATLLQVLNRARTTDGAEVNDLLAAIRDPSRRDEAITRGAGLAAELIGVVDEEDEPQEIVEALDQLHSVEDGVLETPEEALAALNALEAETLRPDPPPQPPSQRPEGARPSASDEHDAVAKPTPHQTAPKQPTPAPASAKPPVARPAPRRLAPIAGWDRFGDVRKAARPAPQPGIESKHVSGVPESPRLDELAVIAALGAEASSFSRLRALERELGGFRGASLAALRKLVNTFPDGWVRRRALVAMITSGVPSSALQALELISGLEREVDRQWCLGALAQRGDLKGPLLRRSMEFVTSPAGRRRLQTIADRY